MVFNSAFKGLMHKIIYISISDVYVKNMNFILRRNNPLMLPTRADQVTELLVSVTLYVVPIFHKYFFMLRSGVACSE
jgi:hypothetical protein